jgi:hypothetical protein
MDYVNAELHISVYGRSGPLCVQWARARECHGEEALPSFAKTLGYCFYICTLLGVSIVCLSSDLSISMSPFCLPTFLFLPAHTHVHPKAIAQRFQAM